MALWLNKCAKGIHKSVVEMVGCSRVVQLRLAFKSDLGDMRSRVCWQIFSSSALHVHLEMSIRIKDSFKICRLFTIYCRIGLFLMAHYDYSPCYLEEQ